MNKFVQVITYDDGLDLGFPRDIIGGGKFDGVVDSDQGQMIVWLVSV